MRPRCAICTDGSGRQENGGTEATSRLCSTCRADPANADWAEGHPQEDLSDAIDERSAPLRLADLIQTPLSPTVQQNRMIVALLSGGQVPKIRSVRVRLDGGRCYLPAEFLRPPSIRDVARIVGASKSRVWWVWHRLRTA